MDTQKITDRLIDFALNFKYEDIPENVIAYQECILLDSIGVMSAATTLEPACTPFIDFAVENSVKAESVIFGTDKKASPLMAALANGSLIHALDYEDGHDYAKAHPNTASIPVIMAFAQSLNKSGKEVVAALAIASEIAIRMKLCLTVNDLFDCGIYSPPMFSAYGAVLGAARLVGLSKDETLDALSICETQIFLPGQSARSAKSSLRGVREALSARAAAFGIVMAQRGVHARMDEPLEGTYGLYMSCFSNQYDEEVLFADLGKRWEAANLRFKAWPCCGTAHALIADLSDILNEQQIEAEDIKDIHIIVNKPHINLLEPKDVKYRPKALAQAKFSIPYILALTAVEGEVVLDSFKEDKLEDAKLLAVADKVSWEMRPEEKPENFVDDHVEVTVTTSDGKQYYKEVFVSPGSPKLPLTQQLIENKFVDCLKHAQKRYAEEDALKIIDVVLKLHTYDNLDALTKLI